MSISQGRANEPKKKREQKKQRQNKTRKNSITKSKMQQFGHYPLECGVREKTIQDRLLPFLPFVARPRGAGRG
jgi:hypothetical protein